MVPVYCRCTPAERRAFLMNPVSSAMNTPPAGPRRRPSPRCAAAVASRPATPPRRARPQCEVGPGRGFGLAVDPFPWAASRPNRRPRSRLGRPRPPPGGRAGAGCRGRARGPQRSVDDPPLRARGGGREHVRGSAVINPLLLQVEVATPASATNHQHYCSDRRNNESDGKTSDDSPLPFTTAAVIGRIVTSK